MRIDVIHIKDEHRAQGKLVYVGRSAKRFHFGNPFTHLQNTLASVVVKDRDTAIAMYSDWLSGKIDIETERRDWILQQIDKFAECGESLTLECFCKPAPCHGDILKKLILEKRYGTQEAED